MGDGVDDADDDVVEGIGVADDTDDLDAADDVVDEADAVDDFDAVSVLLQTRMLMRQCSDDGAEDGADDDVVEDIDDADDADDDVVEDIDDADTIEAADDVVDEADAVDDFDSVSVSRPTWMLMRQFLDDGAVDDRLDDIDDAEANY